MKDKRLFTLKRPFEQPIWVQKITRGFSFNNAKKFSTYAYAVGIFIVLWAIGFQFLTFVPMNWRIAINGFIAWSVGLVFSDYHPDGKNFPAFLLDFAINYFLYTRKSGYWVKGVYHSDGLEKGE